MNTQNSVSESGMNVVDGCLIASAPNDIHPEILKGFTKSITARITAGQIKKVIINVAAVQVMDSCIFQGLANTAKTAAMLGARTVFVGFAPGVASSMVDLDMDVTTILTAVTYEDALDILNKRAGPSKTDKTRSRKNVRGRAE